MEELRDTSIHHTAIKLFGDIKSMKLYENLFKMVQVWSWNYYSFIGICLLLQCLQKLACSPDVDKDNMKTTLEMAIKGNGLETEIRNIVFHLIRNTLKAEMKTTMLSVRLESIWHN